MPHLAPFLVMGLIAGLINPLMTGGCRLSRWRAYLRWRWSSVPLPPSSNMA
ncbi:hypothetical protein [Pseudogemmobacter bohemicus]|uniref:hypothetical protein n=1 Tax=Pseudogemmobacter bohemicus TaxID=2250708 RepID=UPI0018E4FF04|nr:hypothetical protein [Pseudogemmobacter bohemicus]